MEISQLKRNGCIQKGKIDAAELRKALNNGDLDVVKKANLDEDAEEDAKNDADDAAGWIDDPRMDENTPPKPSRDFDKQAKRSYEQIVGSIIKIKPHS